MPIRVLINGAFGKMGQMTAKTIGEHPSFELVGQTGKDYDLRQSILDSKADVVIDFTHPDVVFQNSECIIEANARPVIGTTGLTQAQVAQLQKKCADKNLGGVVAPNFSLGAVLMMKHAKEIIKYMPYAEIIECHHDRKVESPSGTAMRTAEMLAQARTKTPDNITSKEILAGARGAKHHGIPIHAIRLPGFLAHQRIIFGNSGETLTIQHDTIDRQSFMPGICLACEKVMKINKLVYGLDELL